MKKFLIVLFCLCCLSGCVSKKNTDRDETTVSYMEAKENGKVMMAILVKSIKIKAIKDSSGNSLLENTPRLLHRGW